MQKLDLWLRSVWALWDTHGTRLLGIFGTWFALLSALAVAVTDQNSKVSAGLLVISGFLGEMTRARGQNNANAAPPAPPVVPPAVLLVLLGLVLLMPQPGAAAQSPGAEPWPVKEGRQFIPDNATQLIRLCRPTLGCTPGKAFAVQQWNCGYWNFSGNFPADTTYPGLCDPVPTVVVPPPVTPPPVTLPPVTPPIVVPLFARLKFCGINLAVALKEIQVRLVPITDPTIGYPGVAVWLCPNGSNWVQVQYYTNDQLAAIVIAFANKKVFTTAEMQAWIDAQPVEHLTDKQRNFILETRATWSPRYEVTVDQPVYPATASGARSTVAMPGATVKAGTWCWMKVRPTTSASDWYSVKGRAVRADMTLIETSTHYFARCKLKNPFAQ